jgi:TPR repeat protein
MAGACQRTRGAASNITSRPRRSAKKAKAWYLRAAKQGHDDATYNLGVYHQTSRAGPRNLRAAARWFQRAANLGHRGAARAPAALRVK